MSENVSRIRQRELVAIMARSLVLMLNTAKLYNREHPVFRRSITDRESDFQAALAACGGKVSLHFKNESIFFQDTVLEPGNQLFKRLARAMLLKGVGGISWHSPLQTSELVDFIEIVNRELERSVDSLQILLDRRGVGNIREEAVKTVAADQVVADPGKSLEKEPAKAVAKPVKKPEASVFELDLDAVPIEDATSLSDLFETDSEPEPEPGSEPAPPPVQEKTEYDFALSQLRICCHDILDEYDNKAISKQEAVDSLAYEFSERLEERVEEVRRETAIKIQRLENIKDMVMEELEQHGLAAVVATRELEVLSMNRTAREMLGGIDRLPEGSPLAAFVRSGREKQIVRIRGVSRRAHMIISSQQGDDGAILVCLESCENE